MCNSLSTVYSKVALWGSLGPRLWASTPKHEYTVLILELYKPFHTSDWSFPYPPYPTRRWQANMYTSSAVYRLVGEQRLLMMPSVRNARGHLCMHHQTCTDQLGTIYVLVMRRAWLSSGQTCMHRKHIRTWVWIISPMLRIGWITRYTVLCVERFFVPYLLSNGKCRSELFVIL